MTTDSICRSPDFAAKLSELAGIGAKLGVVVRAPAATAREYSGLVRVGLAARGTSGSALIVHGRPEVAKAANADGLLLRRADLRPRDARSIFEPGWIGVSVHRRDEADAALEDGADFVVAGTVFESSSHPGRPGQGIDWLRGLVGLGAPVIAIGGITPERVGEVRAAGASGVAVISAIWDQPDPASAARSMIDAWEGASSKVQLTVNGEPRWVRGSTTLEHLLLDLELDARAVVVELNRRIVRRPELGHTMLQNGDEVELVHFVGGG